MEIFGPPISPDVLDDQRASDALVKLLRKLRWMGMDDDVERIEMTLAARDGRHVNTVISGRVDLD